MDQPRRVIPLQYASPDSLPSPWRQMTCICLALLWPMSALAWGFVVLSGARTVLINGPVVFAAGALLVVSGAVLRNPWGMAIGASGVFITVLLFLLVQAFNWSPDAAQRPFMIIGGAYVLLMAIPSLMAWQRRPA
jgi:hypothetical protein